MHINRLAKSIVGVERIKVRGIATDGAGALVIDAEPYRAGRASADMLVRAWHRT